jgi:hypothetical protein
LCFDVSGEINIDYAREIQSLIFKYIDFLGYNASELLYGVESPSATIVKIDELVNSVYTASLVSSADKGAVRVI